MEWAGITQGVMWRAFDDAGALAYPDFVETVTQLMPMYWIRAIGGTLFFVSALLGVINFIMTFRSRPRRLEVVTYSAPALKKNYVDQPHEKSKLDQVVKLGKGVDEFSQLNWHRKWERFPVRFTIFVTVAITVASAFELVPMFTIRANVPRIATVAPYTPLELEGRDVYLAEGCYNCHSQMVRPIHAEVERYGEYSKPGEFIYDRPFQWGSRRIGPDLHRVGGKYSHDWHVRHLLDPEELVSGSIMPTYPHLLDQPIDYDGLSRKLWALRVIGTPYTDEEVENAAELARAQAAQINRELIEQGGFTDVGDTKVIALVAYLQRLGVDINKSPEAVVEEPAESASAGDSGASADDEGGEWCEWLPLFRIRMWSSCGRSRC